MIFTLTRSRKVRERGEEKGEREGKVKKEEGERGEVVRMRERETGEVRGERRERTGSEDCFRYIFIYLHIPSYTFIYLQIPLYTFINLHMLQIVQYLENESQHKTQKWS